MSTSSSPPLSDEIRQAVHDEDCYRLGHDIDLSGMIYWNDTKEISEVQGPEGKLPHLLCQRCNRVWLLMEESGLGYQDAEVKLANKLKNPEDAKTKRPKKFVPPDRT